MEKGKYYNQADNKYARILLEGVAAENDMSMELAAVRVVKETSEQWLTDAALLLACAYGHSSVMFNTGMAIFNEANKRGLL